MPKERWLSLFIKRFIGLTGFDHLIAASIAATHYHIDKHNDPEQSALTEYKRNF